MEAKGVTRDCWYVVAASAILCLAACGPPTIDASSEEKFDESLNAIRESLAEDEREEFDSTLRELAFDPSDLEVPAGVSFPEINERLWRIKNKLGGMSVANVIAYGKRIRHERALKERDEALQGFGELRQGEQAVDQQELDQVQKLTQELRDKDRWWVERKSAAEQLAKTGDTRASDALLEVLYDSSDDQFVRSAVVGSLAQMEHPRTMEIVIAALNDKAENRFVRSEAVEILGRVRGDPRTFDLIVTASLDEEWLVASAAIRVMERDIGDARVIDPLIDVLKNADVLLRMDAAKSLGKIKNVRSVIPLMTALNDKHEYVRREAVLSLGEIKDPRSLDAIVALLEDEDRDVRKNAAVAVGKLGGIEAASSLLSLLTDWHCKEAAAESLSELGWAPQTTAERIHLAVAQSQYEDLRKDWANTKLVLLGDLRQIPMSAESFCPRKFRYALHAFVGIGKDEVIPELIQHLDTVEEVATAVVYLNCGHKELEKAAREWAQKRGYSVVSGGSGGVRWQMGNK